MTLIVALANESTAVLIADRRITQGQTVLDDEFNKVTVLICKDARLSAAYTGLATCNDFNTSNWLAETLSKICELTPDIHSIIATLETQAGVQFSSLAADDRRLTIVFCGFVYFEDKSEPRIYITSNFEHGSYDPGVFTTRTIGVKGQCLVETAGMDTQLPTSTIETLRNLISQNSSVKPPNLVRFAVKHLQNAAMSAKSLNKIGERCTASVIPCATNSSITTTYHTPRNANKAFGPNVVIAQAMLSLGYEVMSDTILAGPEIRKQDNCWCGSGTQFKNCHMRKYGAMYVKHPAWSRPLTPFFRVVRDEKEGAWPSGNVIIVQSCYQ